MELDDLEYRVMGFYGRGGDKIGKRGWRCYGAKDLES